MRTILVLMIAFLITGMMFPANAAEAQMKTKTITLYSGTGFVAKEAEINSGTGSQNVSFFVPKQTDNESMVIIDDGATIKQFKINESTERDSVIQKMVTANKNKQVTIITQYFKISGTIKEIFAKQYLEISEPKLIDSNFSISSKQSMLVPISSIQAMSLSEKATIETEEQSKQKQVTVSENAIKSSRKIKALYFVSGASWNPNYQLFWENDTKATLYYFAKASNYTDEDWNNVKLQIVSGQPNMKYNSYSRSYYNESLSYETDASYKMAGGAAPMAAQNAFVSSEEQEYHVYDAIDGITIEKNSEAMIPIFSKTVNYEKEYEWRAGDSQVKYNLRVFNNTGEPLAAGFLSAFSNNMYVGGNSISWTAEDGNALVYLSPALDITAKKTTDTKQDNRENGYTTYYTIKLRLENHKSTIAKVKMFDFVPKDAEQIKSDIAPDSIGENNEGNNYCGYYYCGNSGDRRIDWTVPLKAGEKKDITVTYQTNYYKETIPVYR